MDQAGSNDEKNEGSKISLDCPFKDICEAAVQNPNQHSPSGPYMFHIFTDYVNYIQIKIWRKYCVCAASRDFGSHLAHSCGPEMEHRPRKLELKNVSEAVSYIQYMAKNMLISVLCTPLFV